MNIQDTIDRAFASAGLNTDSSTMRHVSDTIRKALASAGLATSPASEPTAAPAQPADEHNTIDVLARDVSTPQGEAPPTRAPQGDALEPDVRADAPQVPLSPAASPVAKTPAPQAAPGGKGRFVTRTFHSPVGTRVYKLYIPAQAASAAPRSMPLVLMLHGCTQSADDFAAGTRMNTLADAQGFLVAYPEQASGANASRCWNWFRAQDQLRDSGEPAILAGIARAVAADQPVDPARIFVAGLSAGAAMAIILGETYPELFAAVGAHSGLPYAAAHDVSSALAAMKGRGILGRSHLPGTPDDPRRPTLQAVPVIVFHGDRDHTVQLSNGNDIVQQASHAHAALATSTGTSTSTPTGTPKAIGLNTRSEAGTTPGGRRYTRTVHTDHTGQPRVEAWTLHGGGHAWSGGSPAGSYTDPNGPDASAEMLRFFVAVAQHRAEPAVSDASAETPSH